MTIGEVMDVIDAYCERTEAANKRDERLREALTYVGAKLTGIAFNEPKKFPAFETVFPENGPGEAPEREPVPQWKRQQMGFAAWVAAYNDSLRRRSDGN